MKLLIKLILLNILALPVSAQTFFEPEWSEFCPNKYKNISANSWHYTKSGRYWAERRKDFEKRIKKCNSLEKNLQSSCYKEVREIENNASKLYNEDRKSQILNRMLINSVF